MCFSAIFLGGKQQHNHAQHTVAVMPGLLLPLPRPRSHVHVCTYINSLLLRYTPILLSTLRFVSDPRLADATRSFPCRKCAGIPPTRLIAAWGDSESMTYHGTDVAKGEVIMFGGAENADVEPLGDVMSDPDVSFFDITAVSGTRNRCIGAAALGRRAQAPRFPCLCYISSVAGGAKPTEAAMRRADTLASGS